MGNFDLVASSSTESALLAVAFAVLFYAAILGHELAHAWVARLCGFPVHSITLWALGGFTAYERRTSSPLREGIIAASGPVTSIALGLGARALSDSAAVTDIRVATLLWALGVSNIYLGIFNALPGLPLDGGAVLKSVVWGVTRDETRGTVVAAWAGRVVAVLVFVALLWPDMSQGRAPDITVIIFGGLISVYLFTGASQTLKSALVARRVPGITARALARRAVVVGGDVPLAEALRQVEVASAAGIVVVDAAGRPTAIAQEAAVAAVPLERRPWVPVASVSAALHPGARLSADLEGMDLLHAMRAVPSPHYLVTDVGGGLVGVLSSAEVDAALSGSR
jgi:Zn-dependent protease